MTHPSTHSPTLQQNVSALAAQLTPDLVGEQVRGLLDQEQDIGGGVNALRLIKQLLAVPVQDDAELTWAYERLKPALRAALEQLPSLYFFEGD